MKPARPLRLDDLPARARIRAREQAGVATPRDAGRHSKAVTPPLSDSLPTPPRTRPASAGRNAGPPAEEVTRARPATASGPGQTSPSPGQEARSRCHHCGLTGTYPQVERHVDATHRHGRIEWLGL